MQRTQITIAAWALVVVTGWDSAAAQNQAPTTAMVETYACKFRDNYGPADLDRVVANWNTWMDEREAEPYSAWTWVPFYFTPEEEHDFVWLGMAPDAATLGRSHDDWLTNGKEIQAQFSEISTCDAHFNFAATSFRQPPEHRSRVGGRLGMDRSRLLRK